MSGDCPRTCPNERAQGSAAADRRRVLERGGEACHQRLLLGMRQAGVRMLDDVEPRRHRTGADRLDRVARPVLRLVPLAEVERSCGRRSRRGRRARTRVRCSSTTARSSGSSGSRSMPPWRARESAPCPTAARRARAGSCGCARRERAVPRRTGRRRRGRSGSATCACGKCRRSSGFVPQYRVRKATSVCAARARSRRKASSPCTAPCWRTASSPWYQPASASRSLPLNTWSRWRR